MPFAPRPRVIVAAVLAVLFALLLAAAPLSADEVLQPQAKPNNTCGDPESWVEWDAIIAKNPHDLNLKGLYALRIGLCVQVKQGKLTVDEGTAIFEQARQTLMQQAERAAKRAEPKL